MVISIDCVVNTRVASRPSRMRVIGNLVVAYVAIVVGTVVALGVLTAIGSAKATTDAWVHCVIVAAFAVLLPLRLRSAQSGSVGGPRAVGIISAALFLVNVVEVMVPGLFPLWLQVVMVGIAALMAAVIALVIREALAEAARLRSSSS